MTLEEPLAIVQHHLADAGIETVDSSASEITIPAVHRDVGDIVIRLKGGELTVSIGALYHQHFRLGETVDNHLHDVLVLTQDLGRGWNSGRVEPVQLLQIAVKKPPHSCLVALVHKSGGMGVRQHAVEPVKKRLAICKGGTLPVLVCGTSCRAG